MNNFELLTRCVKIILFIPNRARFSASVLTNKFCGFTAFCLSNMEEGKVTFV